MVGSGHTTAKYVTWHIVYCCRTQAQFVCLTHSEEKPTETLEFGAEKGLFQGQARRVGS